MLGFGRLPGHFLEIDFPFTVAALVFLAANHFATVFVVLVLDGFLALLAFFIFLVKLIVSRRLDDLWAQFEQLFKRGRSGFFLFDLLFDDRLRGETEKR